MIQKTIQDYYTEIAKDYPDIPLSDIKRILQYGFKSLLIHNNYGGDVGISNSRYWFYSGELMNDSLKYFAYYKRKMIMKMRTMYVRWKVQWDGYYYFALTNSQYEKFKSQIKRRGRPKKYLEYGNVYLYKLFDECNLDRSSYVAIFRVPCPVDLGFIRYKENYISDKAELILEREPLKFSDILVSNYDYQFRKDKVKKYKKRNNA